MFYEMSDEENHEELDALGCHYRPPKINDMDDATVDKRIELLMILAERDSQAAILERERMQQEEPNEPDIS